VRTAGERALQPADLEQVDADGHARRDAKQSLGACAASGAVGAAPSQLPAAGYSTVTVFARLRG
jgi:hypothetical protein